MRLSLSRLLFEDESKDKPKVSDEELKKVGKTLEDIFDQSVPSFVDDLKKAIKDEKVQAVIEMGGDALTYSQDKVNVKDLRPMQTEIGFDQSVKNLLTDQYGSLKSMLGKGSVANVGGPIVTYGGKWIIDGHHRWSQVFVANPSAKIPALDINMVDDLKPEDILKSIHIAIAKTKGEVPSSDPKGINILGEPPSKSTVREQVDQNLSDKAKILWTEYLGGKSKGINEALTNYLHKNLVSLSEIKPGPGAPGRKDMPQTDAIKGKSTQDVLNKAASGDLNITPSFVEEGAVFESKRWAKLAGILKG
jgi:hypothetical protein